MNRLSIIVFIFLTGVQNVTTQIESEIAMNVKEKS